MVSWAHGLCAGLEKSRKQDQLSSARLRFAAREKQPEAKSEVSREGGPEPKGWVSEESLGEFGERRQRVLK